MQKMESSKKIETCHLGTGGIFVSHITYQASQLIFGGTQD